MFKYESVWIWSFSGFLGQKEKKGSKWLDCKPMVWLLLSFDVGNEFNNQLHGPCLIMKETLYIMGQWDDLMDITLVNMLFI